MKKIAPYRRLTLALLASGIALSVAGTIVTASTNGTPVRIEAVNPHAGYADLAEAVMPAVVNVQIKGEREGGERRFPPGMEEFFERFGMPFPEMPEGDRSRPFQGVGSGFIISSDGLIVTNAHVVGGADSIEVTLHDGVTLEAELIGADDKTDLALLRVAYDEPLTYVQFADSDKVRVGDAVVAVGNPFGLGGTVTAGIVSAKGREIGAGPYDDFFQVDAAINRGNSGGPTFNLEGEVVGVNSMIFSPSGGSVGIGFAIAANLAKDVIEDLSDDGKVERGWLGVSIQGVDPDLAGALKLADEKGALVSQVLPDSPAAKAGIQPGDVIVGLGDKSIERVRDLTRAVADVAPGTGVEIEVIREGAPKRITVEIGELSAETEVVATQSEPQEKPRLGLSLAALTPELRNDLGLADDVQGVVVTGVAEGSPAAEKGLRRGDVIMRFGDVAVTDPQQIVEEVDKAAAQGETQALLLVNRDGQQLFRAVPFDLS